MKNPKRLVIGVVGLAFAVMACVALYTPEETAPSPQVQTPPTAAPVAITEPPTYGDGTYQVGHDIPPGIYRTKGSQAGMFACYYARLSDLSEDAIIENDAFYGPGILKVGEGDMYLKLTGRCEWTRET